METTGPSVFETAAEDYDDWFEQHPLVYEAEIRALKSLAGPSHCSLEVGAGTGRFALPLDITFGLEPAQAMALQAQARGIRIVRGVAEALPFPSRSFDLVLMVTTLCFFRDPFVALTEATRVLTAPGRLLIGMIDKDSPLGRVYEANRHRSPFYRQARFYRVRQVLEWLRDLGYPEAALCQTIFKSAAEISGPEPVRPGHGDGGFAVISVAKLD
jgi:ubiquinone/menaquinone biosynthesis C-methylase UbiE